MAFTRDIRRYLNSIGQANSGYLSQRRVWLLRSVSIDTRACAPPLWGSPERGRLSLGLPGRPAFTNKLVDSRHRKTFSRTLKHFQREGFPWTLRFSATPQSAAQDRYTQTHRPDQDLPICYSTPREPRSCKSPVPNRLFPSISRHNSHTPATSNHFSMALVRAENDSSGEALAHSGPGGFNHAPRSTSARVDARKMSASRLVRYVVDALYHTPSTR